LGGQSPRFGSLRVTSKTTSSLGIKCNFKKLDVQK
jgi:hypothetical protein